MDNEIYPSEEVGRIANGDFLSVRIQADSTSKDGEEIRQWYSDAGSICKTFHVNTFPTLLFFTPDGRLARKEVGYKSKSELISLLNQVITMKEGYGSRIAQYKARQLSFPAMGELALEAKKVGDSELADSIATDYRVNFLERLDDSALLTAQNLKFIARFPSLIREGDRFFTFFYYHGKELERLAATRPEYALDVVKVIISNEEINWKIYKDGKIINQNPHWKSIHQSIQQKYTKELADLLVTLAELHYFKVTGNWEKYAGIFKQEIHQYPPQAGNKFFGGMFDDVWELNVQAWNVFLHCTDKKLLREALEWSNLSIRLAIQKKDLVVVQYLDTKANLLYKLGLVMDAIALERHIIDDVCKSRTEAQGYIETMSEMQAGQPTWPTN
jgi:hypothetical protein